MRKLIYLSVAYMCAFVPMVHGDVDDIVGKKDHVDEDFFYAGCPCRNRGKDKNDDDSYLSRCGKKKKRSPCDRVSHERKRHC